MSFSVGLTGGIASGKSTVANYFAELEIEVIDADLVARQVVLPGSEGLKKIVEVFGPKVLLENQGLDRKALRKLVFSNQEATEKLNKILHPRIREIMFQRSNAASGPYHLLDIPLLVEAGWQNHLDRVLVVECKQKLQIERLIQRDKSDRKTAMNIINRQASSKQRLAVADDVIDNNGSIDQLASRVYQLHQQYIELAHQAQN